MCPLAALPLPDFRFPDAELALLGRFGFPVDLLPDRDERAVPFAPGLASADRSRFFTAVAFDTDLWRCVGVACFDAFVDRFVDAFVDDSLDACLDAFFDAFFDAADFSVALDAVFNACLTDDDLADAFLAAVLSLLVALGPAFFEVLALATSEPSRLGCVPVLAFLAPRARFVGRGGVGLDDVGWLDSLPAPATRPRFVGRAPAPFEPWLDTDRARAEAVGRTAPGDMCASRGGPPDLRGGRGRNGVGAGDCPLGALRPVLRAAAARAASTRATRSSSGGPEGNLSG